MSRIGKLPISVPSGTTVTVEGQTVKAKGSKGELALTLSDLITPKMENNELVLAPRDDLVQSANDKIEAEKARGRRLPTFAEALDSRARTQWGTSRARVANWSKVSPMVTPRRWNSSASVTGPRCKARI